MAGRHAKPATWSTLDADERAYKKSRELGFLNARYAGKHAGGLAGVAYGAAQRRALKAWPHYCTVCDGVPCICKDVQRYSHIPFKYTEH